MKPLFQSSAKNVIGCKTRYFDLAKHSCTNLNLYQRSVLSLLLQAYGNLKLFYKDFFQSRHVYFEWSIVDLLSENSLVFLGIKNATSHYTMEYFPLFFKRPTFSQPFPLLGQIVTQVACVSKGRCCLVNPLLCTKKSIWHQGRG